MKKKVLLFLCSFVVIIGWNFKPNMPTHKGKKINNILIMGNEGELINEGFASALTYYFSTIDSNVTYYPTDSFSNYKISLSTNQGNIEMIRIPIILKNIKYYFFVNSSSEQSLKMLKSDYIEFDAFILNILISNGAMPYSRYFIEEVGKKKNKNILSYFSWCEASNDLDLNRYADNELKNIYINNGLDTLNSTLIYGARDIDSIKSNDKWLEKFEIIHSFLTKIN